jgi:hypothetical protein
MKKQIVSLLLPLFLLANSSQSQSFNFAKAIGGSSQAKLTALGLDSENNTIISGTFRDSIQIGTNKIFTPDNSNDNVFVAKFDSLHNLIWVKSFEGTGLNGRVNIKAMSVSTTDNKIVLTGEFRNQVKIADTTISEPNNKKSLLIILLNADGSIGWVSSSNGATSSIELEGTSIDVNDSMLVIGGKMKGSNHSIGGFAISNTSGKDVGFVVKYNKDGQITNAATVLTCGNESAEIQVLKLFGDKIFALGTMKKNSASIGSGSTINVTNTSGKDQFVVFSLNNDLSANWGKSSLQDVKSKGAGLEIDNSGNIYIACEFEEEITLASGISLSGYGKKSSFIASYTNSGEARWISTPVSSSTSSELKITNIAIGNGLLYFIAEFLLDFEIGDSSLNSFSKNGMLALYNTEGQAISAVQLVSDGENKIEAIVGNDVKLVIGGEMRDNIRLPGITNPLELVGGFGSRNAFFASVNSLQNSNPDLSTTKIDRIPMYVNVYPNPFQSTLSINIQSIKPVNIRIIDISGKEAFFEILHNSSNQLNLDFLNAGIYLLQVKSESESMNFKLIKN